MKISEVHQSLTKLASLPEIINIPCSLFLNKQYLKRKILIQILCVSVVIFTTKAPRHREFTKRNERLNML